MRRVLLPASRIEAATLVAAAAATWILGPVLVSAASTALNTACWRLGVSGGSVTPIPQAAARLPTELCVSSITRAARRVITSLCWRRHLLVPAISRLIQSLPSMNRPLPDLATVLAIHVAHDPGLVSDYTHHTPVPAGVPQTSLLLVRLWVLSSVIRALSEAAQQLLLQVATVIASC